MTDTLDDTDDHRPPWLRVRCRSRADFIRIVADATFSFADLDEANTIGREMMASFGITLAEPVAQRMIEDPRIEFIFEEADGGE